MPASESRLPYERLMAAAPVLLWALERSWTEEQATRVGCELEARENSAWRIFEGTAIVTHDGVEHVAGPGQWMFPKPGRRTQRFLGPFRFLSVTVRLQWPDGHHLYEQGLTKVAAAAEIPWLEEIARDVSRSAARVASGTSFYLGTSSLSLMESMDLFAAASRWAAGFAKAMDFLGIDPDLGETRDPRLEAFFATLRALPPGATVSRERIAAATGISPRQLDRLLKESTGKTLADHHEGIRHEHACLRLLQKGSRIKEVASECGFGDLSSFSRWFTRRAGLSPRAYRQRYEGPAD